MGTAITVFVVLLVVLVSFVSWFFPVMIAVGRGHRNTVAITALTLLLGWTAIGWIVATVWAFTDNTTDNVPDHRYAR